MDREFFSFFYSPDLGQRTVKTNFQRMLGEGKQWILDAELGFPKWEQAAGALEGER